VKRARIRGVAYAIGILVSAGLASIAVFVLVAVASADPTENRAPALRIGVASAASGLALIALLAAWRWPRERPERWPRLSALWVVTTCLLVCEWLIVLASGRN
jgi:drug/metabolite transporter (DMT)-like permease